MFADSEAAKLIQENRKLKIYAELILNALNIANDEKFAIWGNGKVVKEKNKDDGMDYLRDCKQTGY